jgi:hypothetical protein
MITYHPTLVYNTDRKKNGFKSITHFSLLSLFVLHCVPHSGKFTHPYWNLRHSVLSVQDSILYLLRHKGATKLLLPHSFPLWLYIVPSVQQNHSTVVSLQGWSKCWAVILHAMSLIHNKIIIVPVTILHLVLRLVWGTSKLPVKDDGKSKEVNTRCHKYYLFCAKSLNSITMTMVITRTFINTNT